MKQKLVNYMKNLVNIYIGTNSIDLYGKKKNYGMNSK